MSEKHSLSRLAIASWFVLAAGYGTAVVACGSGTTDPGLDTPGSTSAEGVGGTKGKGGSSGKGGSTSTGGSLGSGGTHTTGTGGSFNFGDGGPGTDGGCGLVTCKSAGATCGMIGDGCNGTIDCGDTCPDGQTCGGGGVPNVCGSNGMSSCTPKSCMDQGFDCGPAGDGCGNVLDCGTCGGGMSCGGGGKPSVCGSGGSGVCSNLCMQQMNCGGGVTTTISGTVYAPTPPKFGSPDPIYNAIIYIPNSQVQPFPQGASCDQCGTDVSGSPLVLTNSAYDGTFQLENVPVGNNIPVVFQIGKWRRQITVNVNPCVDNPLTADESRLPRNQSEGDIPQIAVSTGSADGLECVLRKIGIDDSEFTLPANQGGTGRVNLFVGNGASDSTGQAEIETVLEGNPNALAYFDLAVLDCQGAPSNEKPYQQNVINWANSGGRIFASHYSYDWLYDDPPFSTTADWSNPMGDPPNGGTTVTGIIDQSFPKGVAFAKWLDVVGASTAPGSGEITINEPRDDLPSTTVNAQTSQRWIYTESPDPETIQHYTFNTPVGVDPSMQCGRVLFSDFHVTGAMGMSGGVHHSDGMNFPQECDNNPMSPQEKVLEFMLFDLSSCVETNATPMCSPTTCQAQNISCGPAGDGCGNLLQCGMCTAPQTCGGGGVPGQCGNNGGSCVPKTCQDIGYMCGPAGDGCGNIIECGACTPPETCGGAGKPGQCGGGIH